MHISWLKLKIDTSDNALNNAKLRHVEMSTCFWVTNLLRFVSIKYTYCIGNGFTVKTNCDLAKFDRSNT